jgi:enoyl-CoA hydratase
MSDGYSCFDIDLADGIATVTLCRGDELNTMTPAFWDELPKLVRELDAGGGARAMVLASTGRHFSAGMDLAVFADGGGGGGGSSAEPGRVRANLRSNVLHLQETFSCLEKARMPVLAAIQGGCIGGAVDMVTACDMRYATEDAFFCIQEINIGMTADVGTLQRLPKLIPEGVCRELAYTGRRMPAAEAKAVGLVNEVFADHEALLAGVQAVAVEIASKSPLAIWGTKEMVRYARDHSTADALDYIATWQAGMFHPADMVESFTAKAEGRDPEFESLRPFRGGVGGGV